MTESNGNGEPSSSNGNGKAKRLSAKAKRSKGRRAVEAATISGGDLPAYMAKDKLSRSDMVKIESDLRKHEDDGQLYNIPSKFRQNLLYRVYGCGLAKESAARVILRAAQVAAMFDRVNLSYRIAGFGDFAASDKVAEEEPVNLDRDYLNFARSQALEFSRGRREQPSIEIQKASPLTLATFGSRGEWLPAGHLLYLDSRVCRMIERAEADLPGPRIILVDAPPRHGKSEYCSKWLPTWFLGQFPKRKVMLASYSDAFSRLWGRATKDNMIRVGRRYFDVGVSAQTRAANEWMLDRTDGGMITSGIGGSYTGRGSHLMIIDDPVKNADEAISETSRQANWDWWQSTAWTRLEPGAVVLVVMTRWHEDDLAGRIQKAAADRGIEVERISFPAIAEEGEPDILGRSPGEALWPERWSANAMEERRKMLDSYWWRALYQGKPGSFGDSEWPEEYFDSLYLEDGETWPDRFESSVCALDPSKGKSAKRGDYSALSFIGVAGGRLWVDVDIARRPVPQMCMDAVTFGSRYGCDVFGVEVNAFQDLLIGPLDEAASDAGVAPLPICEINNQTNKGLRISRLGPWLARKRLRLRRSPSASILVQQLKDHPNGTYDDGPDSLEMALRLLRWFLDAAGEGESLDPDVPADVRAI